MWLGAAKLRVCLCCELEWPLLYTAPDLMMMMMMMMMMAVDDEHQIWKESGRLKGARGYQLREKAAIATHDKQPQDRSGSAIHTEKV